MTPIEIITMVYVIGTSVISLASIIARYTPTRKDDDFIAKVQTIIQTLSIPLKIKK